MRKCLVFWPHSESSKIANTVKGRKNGRKRGKTSGMDKDELVECKYIDRD